MLDSMLLAVLMLSPPQAQPAAPPARPSSGTAIIRGQITDKETGAPISRAAVSVRLFAPVATVIRNLADNDGRFEFLNLPAGRYEITATAGEHRATHQRDSHRPFPGPPGTFAALLLRDGEIRTNVNIALSRTVAISGRVVDDYGDPVSGVSVRVTSTEGSHAFIAGGTRSTDDRGMFRLFGVTPGRYIVCAVAESNPRARVGTTATAERFVTTCHPSTLNESDAGVVTVSNADLDGIEIRMQRSRSFSISGIAVDSTGAVAESPYITFVRYGLNGRESSIGSRAHNGHFVFSGLTPGEYAVQATTGGFPDGPPDGHEQEHGHALVRLTDADVDGLVVAMKKPATVHGRIVFEDGPPATGESSAMTISLRGDDRSGAIAPAASRPAKVDQNQSFMLNGLFGRHRVVVDGIPRGWVVKAVRYKGEDITDVPTEFVTTAKDQIEIALTSRVAIVSGSVADDSGRPATNVGVMLLPADPRRRASELSWYRSAFVARDGRFTSLPARAGDYLIVAIASDQIQALLRQRATVERVAKHAERLSLVEHDRVTVNLRVVDVSERR